jgi:exonuclease SbcC
LMSKEAELVEQINDLAGEIGKLPTLEIFLQAQTSQQKILQDWQERVKLASSLAAAEVSVKEYAKQLEAATQACEQYSGDLEALQAVIDGSQEASTNAKIALGHLATYRQIAKAREATATRLAEIAAARQRTAEPASVSDDEFKRLTNDVAVLGAKIQPTQHFIQMFGQAGVAECPTCHTPTSNLTDAVATAQKQLAELQQQLEQAKQLSTAAAVQRTLRASWEKQEAEFLAEIKQLTESATTFSQVSVPAISEEELVKAVADYEKLQRAKAEIEPLAQKEKERKAGLDGRLDSLIAQKISLTEQIEKLTVTQIDADLAQHALDALSQQCVQRQNLEKQSSQLEFERTNLLEKIATVQADEQKAEKLRDWAAVATVTRDALKVAPRLVAKRNLQRLELAINELLQVFGVDFLIRAATDESPTFVAEFFDGRKQPAKRLSYGQKTVLALAFRVAVNALFADQIGLLALDEPTAYLDQQRIRALAPVLERLRELSTARGLQCLMVTHETSLSHLFESAVELDT